MEEPRWFASLIFSVISDERQEGPADPDNADVVGLVVAKGDAMPENEPKVACGFLTGVGAALVVSFVGVSETWVELDSVDAVLGTSMSSVEAVVGGSCNDGKKERRKCTTQVGPLNREPDTSSTHTRFTLLVSLDVVWCDTTSAWDPHLHLSLLSHLHHLNIVIFIAGV